ncbi:hypothetical protein XA3_20120 [Xylocopilactobacillus apicola]|uniref:Aminoglycoside phosphotransferase domain-containing protein n=2 Tax=Xylocopilactobacillus apicola TaxID=2932184 RepID=A0AAU9D407_9LACO|nr:hypothetical protein XA3_20120 [Xylocopilactobacillus apicola]
MNAELQVNKQLNNRVLDIFNDEQPILIMKDLAPADLIPPITRELATKMGEMLRKFHHAVQPFTQITSFRANFTRSGFEELSGRFIQKQAIIDADLSHQVVLHGDVGLRNYKLVAGKITLIDFERAQLGIAQRDFVKLFYQDFAGQTELIEAFLKGYGEFNSIDPETWLFLVFDTALGIKDYVTKVDDPEFAAIAEQMLEDVTQQKRGCDISYKNRSSTRL